MKKIYLQPELLVISVVTEQMIAVSGATIINEEASNEYETLSREKRRNFSVWDDEEEEDEF